MPLSIHEYTTQYSKCAYGPYCSLNTILYGVYIFVEVSLHFIFQIAACLTTAWGVASDQYMAFHSNMYECYMFLMSSVLFYVTISYIRYTVTFFILFIM